MTKWFALLMMLIATLQLHGADPVVPNTGDAKGAIPAAAVFGGELYLFYAPDKYVKTAGSTWSQPMSVPFSVSSSCGHSSNRAVPFNGRLYVFGGCFGVRYMSLDANGQWSAERSVPRAIPNSTVAVVVFKGRIYAMWRPWDDNTSLFYSSMGADEVWTESARLSSGESGSAPAAAVITASDGNEYLYAFWHDRYPAGTVGQHIWYSRMGAALTWSSAQKLQTPDYPLTTDRPAATSTPTGIYIAYKGGYNANLLYKKLGTSLQWANELDTAWDVTLTGPELAHFNGQTWLFYRYQYNSGGYWYIRYQVIN